MGTVPLCSLVLPGTDPKIVIKIVIMTSCTSAIVTNGHLLSLTYFWYNNDAKDTSKENQH